MTRSKKILLYVMAVFYVFAGYNHLANPEFYLRMMPPSLPEPEWLNLLSGLAEIVLGVFLLETRTRVVAAWGIVALLIAVFPANVYMASENIGPAGPGTGAGATNWYRLPLQAVLIAWAWWYTRTDSTHEATG